MERYGDSQVAIDDSDVSLSLHNDDVTMPGASTTGSGSLKRVSGPEREAELTDSYSACTGGAVQVLDDFTPGLLVSGCHAHQNPGSGSKSKRLKLERHAETDAPSSSSSSSSRAKHLFSSDSGALRKEEAQVEAANQVQKVRKSKRVGPGTTE